VATGVRRRSSDRQRLVNNIIQNERQFIESLSIFTNNSTLGTGPGEADSSGIGTLNYMPLAGGVRLGAMGNEAAIQIIANDTIDASISSGFNQPMIIMNPETGSADQLEYIIQGTDVLFHKELWLQVAIGTLSLKEFVTKNIENITGTGASQIVTVQITNHGFETGDLINIVGPFVFAWDAFRTEITKVNDDIFTYDLGFTTSATSEQTGTADKGNLALPNGADVNDLPEGTVLKFMYSQLVSKWILITSSSFGEGGGTASFPILYPKESLSPAIAFNQTIDLSISTGNAKQIQFPAGDIGLQITGVPAVSVGQETLILFIQDSVGGRSLSTVDSAIKNGSLMDGLLNKGADEKTLFRLSTLDGGTTYFAELVDLTTGAGGEFFGPWTGTHDAGKQNLTNLRSVSLVDANGISTASFQGLTDLTRLTLTASTTFEISDNLTKLLELTLANGLEMAVGINLNSKDITNAAEILFALGEAHISGVSAGLDYHVGAGLEHVFEVNEQPRLTIDSEVKLHVQMNANQNDITSVGFIRSGSDNLAASAGFIRMGTTEDIRWRNTSNTDDLLITSGLDSLSNEAIIFQIAGGARLTVSNLTIDAKGNNIIDTGDIRGGTGHDIGETDFPYLRVFSNFFIPEAAGVVTNRFGFAKTGNELYINYETTTLSGFAIREQGITKFKFNTPTTDVYQLMIGPDPFTAGEEYRILLGEGTHSATISLIEGTGNDLILNRIGGGIDQGVQIQVSGTNAQRWLSDEIKFFKEININSQNIVNVANLLSDDTGGKIGDISIGPIPGGFDYYVNDKIFWDLDTATFIQFASNGINLSTDDSISLLSTGPSEDITINATGTSSSSVNINSNFGHVRMSFFTSQFFEVQSANAIFNGLNINMTNGSQSIQFIDEVSGTSLVAPSTAGDIKLFNDSDTGELSVKKFGGTVVSLEATGGGGLTEPVILTLNTITPQTLPTKSTINWSKNPNHITIDKDIEFDFSNLPVAGKYQGTVVIIDIDGTGGYASPLWPTSVKNAPEIPTDPLGRFTVMLYTIDGGTIVTNATSVGSSINSQLEFFGPWTANHNAGDNQLFNLSSTVFSLTTTFLPTTLAGIGFDSVNKDLVYNSGTSGTAPLAVDATAHIFKTGGEVVASLFRIGTNQGQMNIAKISLSDLNVNTAITFNNDTTQKILASGNTMQFHVDSPDSFQFILDGITHLEIKTGDIDFKTQSLSNASSLEFITTAQKISGVVSVGIEYDVPTGQRHEFAINKVVSMIIAATNITFKDDFQVIFNPGTIRAGLNVGGVASIDPNSLTNGDIWYNVLDTQLKARINGATVDLGSGEFFGPWTNLHDAGDRSLINLFQVAFNTTSNFTPGAVAAIGFNTEFNNLIINAGNATAVLLFSANDIKTMDIVPPTLDPPNSVVPGALKLFDIDLNMNNNNINVVKEIKFNTLTPHFPTLETGIAFDFAEKALEYNVGDITWHHRFSANGELLAAITRVGASSGTLFVDNVISNLVEAKQLFNLLTFDNTSPDDGNIWLDTTDNKFKFREDGVTLGLASAGGGANNFLSNLIAPIAFNQDLLPDLSSNFRKIGSASGTPIVGEKLWGNIYLNQSTAIHWSQNQTSQIGVTSGEMFFKIPTINTYDFDFDDGLGAVSTTLEITPTTVHIKSGALLRFESIASVALGNSNSSIIVQSGTDALPIFHKIKLFPSGI